MNCEEAKNLIAIGVFGDPDPADRTALEDHLRDCPACSRVFETMAESRLSFEVPKDLPAPDWEKSWEVISDRAFGRPRGFRVFGIPMTWAVAAASLAIIFVLGFLAGRRFISPPSKSPELSQARIPDADSPLQRYAESLEPVLIDFLNRGETERPREAFELESRILQNMLVETRLWRGLAERAGETSLKGFLDELESLLISLANLKPGDRDSADLLDRVIRERRIRSKLRELGGLKATI